MDVNATNIYGASKTSIKLARCSARDFIGKNDSSFSRRLEHHTDRSNFNCSSQYHGSALLQSRPENGSAKENYTRTSLCRLRCFSVTPKIIRTLTLRSSESPPPQITTKGQWPLRNPC